MNQPIAPKPPKKRGPSGPRSRRSLTDDGIDLTEWRSRHRLTMSDLARQLGLANGLPISNWEKGKSYPRAETLYKLKQIMEAYDTGMANIGVGGGMPGMPVKALDVEVSSINIQDDTISLIDDSRKLSIKLNIGRRLRAQLASVLQQRV